MSDGDALTTTTHAVFAPILPILDHSNDDTDCCCPLHLFFFRQRSRNVHAFEAGLLSSEYDATALNNNIYVSDLRSSSVCGQIQGGGDMGMDFDTYNGFLVDDSPSVSYSYQAGQIITVNVTLTVHHMGHFEFSLCPTTTQQQELATLSQDCFRTRKLEIVQDNIFGAPLDAQYPERAMIPPPQFQSTSSAYILYSYDVRLPPPSENLPNGPYVFKWMYVTANSCYPNGYEQYSIPDSWNFQ
jgi:Lytic polysaccharide mono-oxygenase, cellulose-degrading